MTKIKKITRAKRFEENVPRWHEMVKQKKKRLFIVDTQGSEFRFFLSKPVRFVIIQM